MLPNKPDEIRNHLKSTETRCYCVQHGGSYSSSWAIYLAIVRKYRAHPSRFLIPESCGARGLLHFVF